MKETVCRRAPTGRVADRGRMYHCQTRQMVPVVTGGISDSVCCL